MKKNSILAVIVITFIVIGYMLHRSFLELSLYQLDNLKSISIRRPGGLFKSRILFSLAIGSIPLLYLVVNKISKVKMLSQRLVVAGVIISVGFLFWQLRILYLNMGTRHIFKSELQETIDVFISLQTLCLEIHLLIGFLLGTFISIFLFKSVNKPI